MPRRRTPAAHKPDLDAECADCRHAYSFHILMRRRAGRCYATAGGASAPGIHICRGCQCKRFVPIKAKEIKEAAA